MLLNQWLLQHYQIEKLEVEDFETWALAEHVDAAKSEYQFLPDGQWNEKMFDLAKKEVSEVIQTLFPAKEEIVVVLNTYPHAVNRKSENYTRKIVKNRKRVLFSGQLHHRPEEEFQWIEQCILETRADNLRWDTLIACMLHQDFPPRKPRFSAKHSWLYPAIYLIHPVSGALLFVYDDRGYYLVAPKGKK